MDIEKYQIIFKGFIWRFSGRDLALAFRPPLAQRADGCLGKDGRSQSHQGALPPLLTRLRRCVPKGPPRGRRALRHSPAVLPVLQRRVALCGPLTDVRVPPGHAASGVHVVLYDGRRRKKKKKKPLLNPDCSCGKSKK